MAGDSSSTASAEPSAPAHSGQPAGGRPAQGRPGDSLALYRRYRPATFAEVKGQEQVTEPLSRALLAGRISHAYLFSGPRGCGKTTSARILARSLNCVKGPTPEPCGVCESCIALAPNGPGSIDVIEIDAASHGGVDDARDLRERAFYAPVSGRFKVYIIDEAHMVTREGFNALLKLVEEPPAHLKFIFATTEPEKVIATIRSRTHHYPFRLVPPAVLRQLLGDILAREGVACEPEALKLVIRAGAGSVRDSLSVLDQLLAGCDESGLTYDKTAFLLGYTDATLLDEVTEAFAASDGAAVFRAVDRVVEAGLDPRRFAADMLDRFRDLIVLSAVPDAGQTGLIDAPADRLERMAEQAGRFGQAQLTRAAEVLSEGLVQMRGATAPRLLLELMCAQVLLPGASTDQSALLARLERLERGAATGARPAGPAAQAADHADRAADRRGAAAAARPRSPGDPGGARSRTADAAPGVSAPGRPGGPGEHGDASRAGSGGGQPDVSAAARPGGPGEPGDASRAGSGGGQPDVSAAARPGGPGEPGDASRAGSGGGQPDVSAAARPGSPGDPGGGRAPATGRDTPDSRGATASAPDAPRAAPAGPAPASTAATPAGPGPAPASTPATPAGPAPAPASTAATLAGPAPAPASAPATPGGPTAAPPARPDGPPADADSLRRDWEAVLGAVMKVRRVAWMLLRNAVVQSLEDGVLTIRFAKEGDVKGFASSGCDADLRRVLAESFGLNVQVRAMSGPAPGVPPDRNGTIGAVRENAGISARTAPPETRAERPEPARAGQQRPASPAPARVAQPAHDGDPFDAQDPEASAGHVALTGIDLIKQELGGQIVDETDNG